MEPAGTLNTTLDLFQALYSLANFEISPLLAITQPVAGQLLALTGPTVLAFALWAGSKQLLKLLQLGLKAT